MTGGIFPAGGCYLVTAAGLTGSGRPPAPSSQWGAWPLGEPDYRSSARNRLGCGGMMRPPAGCPAVARAGEMMAACRRRTTSR